MNIEWTARGAHVSDALRERVERGLSRLGRYLRGHTEATIIASQDGDVSGTARQAFEVVVRNRLGTFTARDESHDLSESANAALTRLQTQVQKAHDKMLAGRRRATDQFTPEAVGNE